MYQVHFRIYFLLYQIKLQRDPKVCYEASKAMILLGKFFPHLYLFSSLFLIFLLHVTIRENNGLEMEQSKSEHWAGLLYCVLGKETLLSQCSKLFGKPDKIMEATCNGLAFDSVGE